MPHAKLKSENYQNFGGINSKVSPYNLGPEEFLDLTNVDFQTPGSLTQRWGSTHCFASLAVGRITGLFDFEQTTGYSQIIFTTSSHIIGQVSTGWTTITNPSLSSTQVAFLPYSSVTGVTTASVTLSGRKYYVHPSHVGTAYYDAFAFLNSAFLANGEAYFQFTGSTLFTYSLPPVLGSTTQLGATFKSGEPNVGIRGGTLISVAMSFSQGDLEGPVNYIGYYDFTSTGATTIRPWFDIYKPGGFNIDGVNIYFAYGDEPQSDGPFYHFQSVNISEAAGYPASGEFRMIFGALGASFPSLNAARPAPFGNLYLGQIASQEPDTTPSYSGNARFPSVLELYSNRVFLSGFTSTPSKVYFSDLGNPNAFQPESNFEVRTNDGDKVTAMKAYGSKLVVMKRRSTHVLTGDNEDNFALSELTSEYGCINNRCATTYGDLLAFFDTKGLIGYNGAALSILSFKIQPLIDRVSQAAAVTHACLVHDKTRNQLLLGVPLDGATINNTTLVYDYFANAWTKYDGFNPSIFAQCKGTLNDKTIFFGGYTGSVSYFGASFLTDAGQGFTCSLRTRFLNELGNSIEKQWRRLYFDVKPDAGATLPLDVRIFRNYGDAVPVLERTVASTSFQTRMDFGISARSIAFDLTKTVTTIPFKFHGYTVEYREQRRS